jgi:hypothetical protein
LWHLRLLRRIALSPEEHGADDLVRLVKALAREPTPVLHLTLHSPSAGVGYTPYVRTEDDRRRLLAALRQTLAFITRELGAQALTLAECAAEFRDRPFPVRRA